MLQQALSPNPHPTHLLCLLHLEAEAVHSHLYPHARKSDSPPLPIVLLPIMRHLLPYQQLRPKTFARQSALALFRNHQRSAVTEATLQVLYQHHLLFPILLRQNPNQIQFLDRYLPAKAALSAGKVLERLLHPLSKFRVIQPVF